MLVWLKDIREVHLDVIRATIPWTISDDAYMVQDLQSSDTTVLPIQTRPSYFRDSESGTALSLQYTAEDHARNIRAYITTLLGALCCRIDIQSSDGHAMVLRYVSSYVSKTHDVPTNEALYSTHLRGYQAAAPFLRTVEPLEPEMFLQLTSMKQAWSSSRTKWFSVPMPEEEDGHAVGRPAADARRSFLEWLRLYNENAAKTQRLIHACLTDEKKVAVATPLAILATGYSYIFPDSTCDTVHSFFRIPVTADDDHTINFGMAQFDLIIIDEASMIDAAMFELIAGTLNKLVKRPIVVIAGDERQQQPLRTVGGTTSQLPSILIDGTLHGVSRKYTLHRQFRCVDPEYAQFLDYVRYCRPQQFVLDYFQRHKVLCSSPNPNDQQLWDIRRDRPKHTVPTVSCASSTDALHNRGCSVTAARTTCRYTATCRL